MTKPVITADSNVKVSWMFVDRRGYDYYYTQEIRVNGVVIQVFRNLDPEKLKERVELEVEKIEKIIETLKEYT